MKTKIMNYKGNEILRTSVSTEVYKLCFGRRYRTFDDIYIIEGPKEAPVSKLLTTIKECKEWINGERTWTTRTSAADNDWRDVCWSPELSLFVAIDATGTGNRIMTSPDGITWTTRTSSANNWTSVCWSPELSLFVAIDATGTGDWVMTSPDGITWATRTSAEVTEREFWNFIKTRDVILQVIGNFPYTSIFSDRRGSVCGKIDDGTSKYYILD